MLLIAFFVTFHMMTEPAPSVPGLGMPGKLKLKKENVQSHLSQEILEFVAKIDDIQNQTHMYVFAKICCSI